MIKDIEIPEKKDPLDDPMLTKKPISLKCASCDSLVIQFKNQKADQVDWNKVLEPNKKNNKLS